VLQVLKLRSRGLRDPAIADGYKTNKYIPASQNIETAAGVYALFSNYLLFVPPTFLK
jgi:hypothetical protein